MGNDLRIGFLILMFIGILLYYLSRESKSKKQEYVKTGIGCLGMIGLISFIVFIQKYDREKIQQNKLESIGKVIGFGRKNSVKWEYSNRKNIKVAINNNDKFNGLQIGEYFMVEYDSSDLKNAMIHFSKPILNISKKDTIYQINFPNGKIDNSHIYVTFEYEYNGIKYERQQELPKKGNWEKFDKFIVVVNTENPKIGYIEPIEE